MLRAAVPEKGLTMPSMADELAALTRSNSARRPGWPSQRLLLSNDDFMPPLSPSTAGDGEEN